MTQRIYFRNAAGELVPWKRTRVRGLPIPHDISGKADESFLEKVVAEKPDLLGIGNTHDESDIEPPFYAFFQLPLRALNGRLIYPDLILLWQSGHVVVVEVKLVDNPELRDRQVVAQLLEYAASLAQCSEQSLFELFGGSARGATSWADLVMKLFPQANDFERLARRLFDKFRSSKLHLIIACDDGYLSVSFPHLIESVRVDLKKRLMELSNFSFTDADYPMIKAEVWVPHAHQILDILRQVHS